MSWKCQSSSLHLIKHCAYWENGVNGPRATSLSLVGPSALVNGLYRPTKTRVGVSQSLWLVALAGLQWSFFTASPCDFITQVYSVYTVLTLWTLTLFDNSCCLQPTKHQGGCLRLMFYLRLSHIVFLFYAQSQWKSWQANTKRQYSHIHLHYTVNLGTGSHIFKSRSPSPAGHSKAGG